MSPEPFIDEGASSTDITNVVNDKANQAEARNIAESFAKGDTLAFCDDDCVLPPNWIENGVKHLSEEDVATVGGPSTPLLRDAPFLELMSGLLMTSFLGTGSHRTAYTGDSEKKPILCNPVNIICANMFVDRVKFREVGGFDGAVPQEEDRLNTKLLKKGYKLVYDPNCVNAHRQRPYGFRFIRNIFWLMAGQGSLTMERFAPSSKWYLVPPFFTVGLAAGLFLLSSPFLKIIYISMIGVYAVSVVAETLRLISKLERRNLERFAVLTTLPFIFILHHTVSGFGFILGFFRQFLLKMRSLIKT